MKNVTIGIYLITERATGKMYVGLSGARGGIEGRWVKYKKLFPQDLFTYEILHPCPPGTTREELSILEKFYVKELDCMEPNGFNRTSGGCGKTEVSEETRKRQSASHKGQVPHNKGKPMSEETRAKLKSQFPHNKGKPMSEDERAKRRGWTHSEEHKAKLKGRTFSEEHRAKLSAAQKNRVRSALSEEHKDKLRGRVHSEETRAKISATKKGGTHSAEHRAKNSAAQKGRVQSEETRAKRSAALKARAALKRAAKAAAVAAFEALLFTETETILSPE